MDPGRVLANYEVRVFPCGRETGPRTLLVPFFWTSRKHEVRANARFLSFFLRAGRLTAQTGAHGSDFRSRLPDRCQLPASML
jgi:hypothetical protein